MALPVLNRCILTMEVAGVKRRNLLNELRYF
jgi:hypothetical protein